MGLVASPRRRRMKTSMAAMNIPKLNTYTGLLRNVFCKMRLCSTNFCTERGKQNDDVQNNIDIEQLFLDQRVQNILMKLTGFDLEKIFHPRKRSLKAPKYQFLTDKQIERLMDESKKLAREKLQMPPVMKERLPKDGTISLDPEIQGYDTCKYIFTDITYGVSDRKRFIVTRHPDGKLEHSSWEERYRMNQIYFPDPKRTIEPPLMFQDEYLKQVLERQEYEFILERACLQFDPDDPVYIRVTEMTYDHIDETRNFETLKSTRQFGPMAFYLVRNKRVDNLLLYMIQKAQIEDAVDLIKLYYIIHPSSKTDVSEEDSLNYIQNFIELEAKKKSNLQLALQTYMELYQQILKDKKSIS